MQSVALPDKCRRRNRSSLHREAVGHQLNHVAETLQLDAIVLADDLGRPLAHAGDPQLASMLAELALWSAPAADELDEATLTRIRALYPDLENRHVVAKRIALTGARGTRVIAAGRSFARGIGVDQAVNGIRRICEDAGQDVFAQIRSTAPAYTGVPRQRRREGGVRWLIFNH